MVDKDIEQVDKILKNINKILEYSKGYTEKSLVENTQVLEACIFNIMQIGESANKISDKFKEKYNHIIWHQMKGLRNRIVHDYEGVNFELITEVIFGDIEELKRELEKIK